MDKIADLKRAFRTRGLSAFKILSLALFLFLFSSCSELEKPQPEPYYAATAPPAKQEFRWSNGKMPKTLDPALASAPPETDIIRAVFEGLTDTDAKSLEAMPAVAEKWTASADFKTWTFNLRKDAKWSNGKAVTAHDFVSSWKRAAAMSKQAARADLFQNIAGLEPKPVPTPQVENTPLFPSATPSTLPLLSPTPANTQPQRNTIPQQNNTAQVEGPIQDPAEKKISEERQDVEAVDDHTLKVRLVRPDKQLPRLLANPVFFPVYDSGAGIEPGKIKTDIVTNGAFRISSIGQDGLTLDRADYYWNRAAIKLERVRFVPKDTAEQALAAYKAGELDAVTNADFEPLVLKLLSPYEDFRQTKHSALNLYEFNPDRPPFNDHRVREALAISIERERLTEGEMEGSSQPALGLLPFDDPSAPKLVQDVEKAKKLLTDAGFPAGENFPVIKLFVNRNDAQQRIARSVAKMWKQNLNIETEITVKEALEIEKVRETGDFDILRRGVVLPTSDETASMMAIFSPKTLQPDPSGVILPGREVFGIPQNPGPMTPGTENGPAPENPVVEASPVRETEEAPILTDEDAMRELSVIPLYFPTSYSLVKSYVQGFEINALDAPSLKDVTIDTGWQPKKPKAES